MRLTALIVLAIVTQETPKQDGLASVNAAAQKLMEKKSYSFVLKQKVDGDDGLKSALDKMDADMTGVFVKDGILHAKADECECARNGGDAMFLYQKKWRTREETNKLFKNKLDSPARNFDTMDNPHDEIGSVREKVATMESKGPETLGTLECEKFAGALTDDGAQTLAKIYFGRLSFKGGTGGGRGSAEPSGGKGTATVWVTKDGIAIQLQYDLAFNVKVGKADYKATLVRTVIVSDFDAAKLELPADVKKKLKIE